MRNGYLMADDGDLGKGFGDFPDGASMIQMNMRKQDGVQVADI